MQQRQKNTHTLFTTNQATRSTIPHHKKLHYTEKLAVTPSPHRALASHTDRSARSRKLIHSGRGARAKCIAGSLSGRTGVPGTSDRAKIGIGSAALHSANIYHGRIFARRARRFASAVGECARPASPIGEGAARRLQPIGARCILVGRCTRPPYSVLPSCTFARRRLFLRVAQRERERAARWRIRARELDAMQRVQVSARRAGAVVSAQARFGVGDRR